jgi:quinol monooxygenase YgiN
MAARSLPNSSAGYARLATGRSTMFRILSSLALAFALTSPAFAAAPATPPAAGPVYVVGYIEVTSTRVPEALPALRAYRDASAREPGGAGVTLYREDAIPSRFVILETWRDQAAYDAHLMAPSVTDLAMKLRPIQAAPPHMLAHRGFSVAPAPAAALPANTIYVMTHIDVPPPQLQAVTGHYGPYVTASRRDRGMLRFDVLQMAARTNHFTVVEAWAGQTNFDAHKAAVHTRTFRDRIGPLLGALYDERIYRLVP